MSDTQKSVLCIEDEYFISELYTRALTKAGYRTEVRFDGQKGMDEAIRGNYDIILLDLMLPQITGIDVLRELRRRKEPIRSKIIITTNLDVKDSLRQELESMADGYIIKAEITPQQLVEFLNQVKIEQH